MPRPVCPCPPPLQRLPGHPEFFPPIQRFSVSSSRPLQPSAPSGTPPLPHRVNQRSSNPTIRATVYISLYVDVNTFIGGRQPQNKLMRLRTFKKLLQRTAALAWGQWAVDLRQYTAALPGGSEQCSSCITLPHCLGAVDSATPATHCLTVWGQWAAELLQCTASLPGGSGQWNSCNALPHCLGLLGSATCAIHCRTAWGQWAAQLLQCTASLPWGSGQRNSCNALPHCLGAVGSATPSNALPHRPGGSGQCNSCNGWSECSAGPVGMYYWAHRPGGMGSPTQGAVGASFRAYGGPSSSENLAHRPGGDGESRPGGGRSLLQGPWGGVMC